MQQERVTQDIFVFTSDLYAQVTATVIATDSAVIVVDTLLYPEETKKMLRFIDRKIQKPIKYVINSHFHADHTMGTCFFENVQVISHRLCRELLDTRGRDGLARTKANSDDMNDVELILPNIVFDDRMTLRFGGKTLEMWSAPGHSPDGIMILVQEDGVLIGADTMMPIPYFVDGSYTDFLYSLDHARQYSYEHIIQGHGEIVLRGEIQEKIDSDLYYLNKLSDLVNYALVSSNPDETLKNIGIEDCGKSHILLNGIAIRLHQANVQSLANERRLELTR